MERSLGLRIALILVGLAALAFGIFTGFAHGWQLDIVNTITIVAGVVLIAVGFRVFFSVPSEPGEPGGHESYHKDFLSLLAIALANPMTILFFLVVLPGFGIVLGGTSLLSSLEFVLGIFTGSVLWWIILCGAVASVRSRLNVQNLQWINRISGALIVLFGIGTLLLLLVHT